MWNKPFTLTIDRSAEGINSVTVTRTSSLQPGAVTGVLGSGDMIFYGDTLTVTAAAKTYYTINSGSYSSSITVDSNVTVAPTATRNTNTITLTKNANLSITLTYHDQAGVEHTAISSGTYTAGQGYGYS